MDFAAWLNATFPAMRPGGDCFFLEHFEVRSDLNLMLRS